MLTRKTYRLIPLPENHGLRLDQFVPAHADELSRTLVRRIVDLGGVHVGGRRIRRCSHPVNEGELVEVYLDGLPLEPFEFRDTAVLYRDPYLLAIDKPAGVETQPTPARYKGTIYAALLNYLHDPYRPQQQPSLGMVQRLDRDTSGVMVFSIHPRAHKGLTQIFAGREVRKLYLSLIAGRLLKPEGEFRSLLARSRATNKVKSVNQGGKEAITRYRVLEEFADSTLVEVEILTGRSHQIRAHFAESGHPLLGDERYGGPTAEGFGRQMLHAWRLSFPHPVGGAPLEIEAPIPTDMSELIEYLRRSD